MQGLMETQAVTPAADGARRRARPGASAARTLVIVAVTAAILLAVAYLSDRRDGAPLDRHGDLGDGRRDVGRRGPGRRRAGPGLHGAHRRTAPR